MSHDEPTLPERRQAEVLARWLDGAVDGIPEELDEDVVEAVIALRPELAPPPALTPEDILAEVREGPLAVPDLEAITAETRSDGARQGGGVTPEVAPLPTPANNRRWVGWAIPLAGGLAAVAAAALLFVGTTLTASGPTFESVATLDEAADRAPRPAPGPAPAPTAASEDAAAKPAPDAEAADEVRVIMGSPQKAEDDRMARSDSVPGGEASKALKDLDGASGLGSGGLGLSGSGRGGGGSSEEGLGIRTRGLGGRTTSGTASSSSSGAGARSTGTFGPSDIGGDVLLDDVAEAEERAPAAAPASASEPDAVADLDVAEIESMSSRDELVTLSGDTARTSQPKRRRAKEKAAEAPVEPVDLTTLERRARPTDPPAAETQAIVDLIDAGKARDARDSAQRLLQSGSLGALRRADLSWALGRAQQALGDTSAASRAYREAIRLRGG